MATALLYSMSRGGKGRTGGERPQGEDGKEGRGKEEFRYQHGSLATTTAPSTERNPRWD